MQKLRLLRGWIRLAIGRKPGVSGKRIRRGGLREDNREQKDRTKRTRTHAASYRKRDLAEKRISFRLSTDEISPFPLVVPEKGFQAHPLARRLALQPAASRERKNTAHAQGVGKQAKEEQAPSRRLNDL